MAMISSFERLLQRARADANVLGVVLSGSRGRGTALPESDWDCYVIVAQDDPDFAADLAPDGHHAGLDATVLTLAAFERYAAPGTRNAWEAYAFAHAAIEHDRLGGRITELAAAKEFLPVEVADRLARVSLDRYLNAAVRSAKCRRDGQRDAAILDAAQSIAPALEAIFAFEERVPPYNRYLEHEVETHPLRIDLPTAAPLPRLAAAAAKGHADASASLFAFMERTARDQGFGDVIDAWDREAVAFVLRGEG
jgi:hypothetical protein